MLEFIGAVGVGVGLVKTPQDLHTKSSRVHSSTLHRTPKLLVFLSTQRNYKFDESLKLNVQRSKMPV